MITREQVADLQPGDVVELKFLHEYDATTITARGTFPTVVDWFENHEGGDYILTVISRAKPPLYVNHPRTEPVPGDVVRVAENDVDAQAWYFLDGLGRQWFDKRGYGLTRDEMPSRLRLLVDGETGQVVQ